MHKIKITCDSTCDLTKEIYNAYDVEVIPMGISMGDDFRRDGIDVTADDLFAYVSQVGQLPKTSAISVGEYLDVFTKYVEEGYQVIHINLSSDLSTSHQSACMAAEEMDGKVFVVDSRNLSTGSGHLVMLAKELANADLSAEEIVAALNDMKNRLDVSFVLQTLDYLHKGGRCSGIAAFGANLMKLRPEIEVFEGKMRVGKKYRGNAEKSILDYVRGRLAGRTDIQLDRIFVTHSGAPEEIIEKVVALVKELHPFQEVIVTRAGCTISTHCGPCCLGVLFFRKEGAKA